MSTASKYRTLCRSKAIANLSWINDSLKVVWTAQNNKNYNNKAVKLTVKKLCNFASRKSLEKSCPGSILIKSERDADNEHLF